MNAKTSKTWEQYKDETSQLSEMINRCGYLGLIESLKEFEQRYVEAHRKMRAFAKRHNLMKEYEEWIS